MMFSMDGRELNDFGDSSVPVAAGGDMDLQFANSHRNPEQGDTSSAEKPFEQFGAVAFQKSVDLAGLVEEPTAEQGDATRPETVPLADFWLSRERPAHNFRISLPDTADGTTYEAFKQQLADAALATGFRYTGLVEMNPDGETVAAYTRTAYPRLKYPMPHDTTVEGAVAHLAQTVDGTATPETAPTNTYRACLGLRLGQQQDSGAPDLTPDYYEQAFRAAGCFETTFALAKVLTVRFVENKETGQTEVKHYEEDVILASGPAHEATVAAQIGANSVQERLTIDFFRTYGHTVSMAETKHCQDPEFTQEAQEVASEAAAGVAELNPPTVEDLLSPEATEDLRFAAQFAVGAGQYIELRQPDAVPGADKADGTKVSDVDVLIGKKFIAAVQARDNPESPTPVLGEEDSTAEPDDIYQRIEAGEDVWVIDPLDGTLEYLETDIPPEQRTTSVGIAKFSGGEVVLAVVYNPFQRLLFSADEHGAYYNGQPLRVQDGPAADLEFAPGSPYRFGHWPGAPVNTRKLQDRLDGQPPAPGYSALFDACRVARGELTGYAFAGNTLHDIAPGWFIVQQAGGQTGSVAPFSWSRMSPGIVYATNQTALYQMLGILREPRS